MQTAQYKAEWNQANKERCQEYRRRYFEKHPEKRKAASAAYRKKNQHWYNAYQVLRNRKTQHAQPSWVDVTELQNIYLEARYQGLEVDHIVPLTHPLVCGLHVPENLQLLTSEENKRKGNKFDEDIQVVLEEEGTV